MFIAFRRAPRRKLPDKMMHAMPANGDLGTLLIVVPATQCPVPLSGSRVSQAGWPSHVEQ